MCASVDGDIPLICIVVISKLNNDGIPNLLFTYVTCTLLSLLATVTNFYDNVISMCTNIVMHANRDLNTLQYQDMV